MLKLTAILKNRLIRSNKKLVKIVRCHVQVTHVKFLSVSCSKTFDICNASIRAYHVSIFLNLELIFMCINFVSVFSVLSVVNQVVSFFYTQPSLVKIKKNRVRNVIVLKFSFQICSCSFFKLCCHYHDVSNT